MTALCERRGAMGAHSSSVAKRSLCRYTPEVGALCGKAARRTCAVGAAQRLHVGVYAGDVRKRRSASLSVL